MLDAPNAGPRVVELVPFLRGTEGGLRKTSCEHAAEAKTKIVMHVRVA